TPFFSPRAGCVPRPMMSRPPSGVTSATIATIFDVPMSRPTIRFLLSFTIRSPSPPVDAAFASGRLFRRTLLESGDPRRKAVAVAQIHLLDTGAVSREHGDRPAVGAYESRQSGRGLVATDLDRQRPTPAGGRE